MIKVGIVGGTGYTGVELLRLLAQHPQAQVSVITSRAEAGRGVTTLFPNLRGHYDHLHFSAPNNQTLLSCDVIFFATPHGVAQAAAGELLEGGAKIIDLSADFRLRDIATWEHWYNQAHGAEQWLPEAVYGLPEFNRETIKNARLVACPGCYPTSVLLGFKPLIENNLVDTQHLIASSASGASGAGRGANSALLLTEIGESFKAYGATGHRHLPEIEQGLGDFAKAAGQNSDIQLTFVPHLLPISRGIHSTLFATLTDTRIDLQALFESAYANEPFIDVLPAGSHPETRTVKGTNMCRIAVHQPQGRDTVVITVVEDNLTKGASGQAIQNMNIMFGLEERCGLELASLLP
ncbi:N-acetyl-gamma-glutamyl-phosphate reductase [Marinagarivorans algicola]|uniref:N-acetyl-gamma-glutamyl-phosphate reductase n=1 Tax=Marinagarivorans algicola TaxID=1513270 RepID=UPI0006B99EB5|nr:N-acetyl-gamma-glutamyl-phosphate reductase [Marinagarivorans algicola]